MTTGQKIAQLLLKTQAVQLSPKQLFKWSSGWNSPIYCDNRVTLSDVEARTFVKESLSEAIKNEFPEVSLIAGVATAGIAQGALVADILKLPFAYVRPEPKKHGMGNQIEGRIPENSKIVILEDLISTGGSSLKVADVLRSQGFEVLGVAAIFNYGFPVAEENFNDKKLKLITLSNYSILIEEALKQNYIQPSDIDFLSEWRENPGKY